MFETRIEFGGHDDPNGGAGAHRTNYTKAVETTMRSTRQKVVVI